MFQRILIANRGEIAVRIIRAARELGVQTVAVYSQADKNSMHVRLADQAICIGPAPSSESYLNIPAIISAAEISNVEAVHPGYGFLAENAHFAEICESCHIKFIGPKPEAIRLMGDKSVARKTVEKTGVPIIPGSEGIVRDKAQALKIANSLKYPVIIKAKAGGGGKGMKVCHNDGALVANFMTAQREAGAAFGNSEVYIEKYFQAPRHIEVQILADEHGNTIHLGERECSIQRRHQKLLEEAPSVALTPELRAKIGRAAVEAAKAVEYVSAGTIECLLDTDGQFYFMEMNTRIQVEHPVTEWVTGMDLVKEQIRIAAGEKLSLKQEEVQIKGHAIECRINAEDPQRDFAPSPGLVTQVIWPGGPGIRIDSHLYVGYTVPPTYDSMVGKVIAYGATRAEAIARMRRALDEVVVEPIKTTVGLHRQILKSPDFVRGNITTHFLEGLLQPSQKVGQGE